MRCIPDEHGGPCKVSSLVVFVWSELIFEFSDASLAAMNVCMRNRTGASAVPGRQRRSLPELARWIRP